MPEDWNKKAVHLFFEGANQETEVFIKGKKVGNHIGGHTAFNFKISSFLHSGKNEIRVKVDNSHNEDIPPLKCNNH